ncbi:class I SAM-dependent methyltransferase [Ktedonospora formicarum]|uniref:Methyltransferase domain-containing protein n=1 Tax=Ktedonospora formicarum TaxID=2778364 RepID=A0A8J3MRX9_9CHLR|nr:class I SAM-dependent methyltransferase [Ktedonospora formicarum]GHO46542.1 hypothetical protein KSX_47050 [Ktedonospora formicarum]
MSSYLFKDTELARQRLQILAEVFALSTCHFLQSIQSKPHSVLDLGCGPGYTTHLLAEQLSANHVFGLDISESFIAYAQQTSTKRVSFACHDITSVPFPVAKVDLVYCRMLLTHLTEVPEVIARWATQLRSGGLLCLEEVEWIDVRQPTLKRYLQIVEEMLRQQANQLYIGVFLESMPVPPTLKCHSSGLYHHSVTTRDAARMFLPNLRTWRDNSYVRSHYSLDDINQLDQELSVLAEGPDIIGEIAWGMRQITYEAA